MENYNSDAMAAFVVNSETYISHVETRKPPISHIFEELREFIAATEQLNTDDVENELGDLIFTAIKLAESRGHKISLIRTMLMNKAKCELPFEDRHSVNYCEIVAGAARVMHQALTTYNAL